jgi:hypothetical protein
MHDVLMAFVSGQLSDGISWAFLLGTVQGFQTSAQQQQKKPASELAGQR